jgi:hypothetical protein
MPKIEIGSEEAEEQDLPAPAQTAISYFAAVTESMWTDFLSESAVACTVT